MFFNFSFATENKISQKQPQKNPCGYNPCYDNEPDPQCEQDCIRWCEGQLA